MNIILVGKGWGEEDQGKERLVLQRMYNGSVYVMGKYGPMLLPVKDRVTDEEENDFGWKEILE